MKKTLLPLMAAGVVLWSIPAAASVSHLLPKVKMLAEKDCVGFALNRPVAVSDATETELLREVLVSAGATIEPSANATVNVSIVESIPGAFNHNLPDYPDEAYSISISENAVNINALTSTGVIRAAQTIAQLAIGVDALEACDITDWPAFKLRGLMHDVGRSFISVDELKKQIRLLSQFKVNTLHWHLTENQAWRFQVREYPQLTSDASMTRFAGSYYTQQECREVMAEAKKHGVIVIPEIDMPGHSKAYERAMGHAMQTAEGKAELLKILEEVADVFTDAPYIHIGGDEVTITDNTFLDTMIDKLHSLGKKVVCWNKINGVNIANHAFDMTQMWATAGSKIAGIPNIDCRYNYINHFDVFADVVGIYKSSIYYEQQGTDEVAGTITAIWNDRKTPTEADIIAQNNLYACTLASAERAWMGGGKQYIETGGTMLPNSGDEFDEFADWERRFLLHKGLSLKNEPIPYVRQTDVRWHVTEMFDNGGSASATFAPEQGLENPSWSVTPVTGAGIYLRHTWGGTVPGLYGNAPSNRTAYAYTYIYSPDEQTVGAHIEFQNYGRSENDKAPDNGNWDRKGSRLWLNDDEIMPPTWDNAGKGINSEVDLKNENFSAREPLHLTLKQGWNKVLIKLPYVSASNVRLNKWMWTFVLVDLATGEAPDGVRYSPSKSIDDDAEALATLIEEARAAVKAKIKDQVGYYISSSLDQDLLAKVDEVAATLSETKTAAERAAQRADLQSLFDAFNSGYAAVGIVQPSTKAYYHIYTPLRGSRYASASGHKMLGVSTPSEVTAWKFVARADGKYDILNYSTGEYVSPSASYNNQLTLTATVPASGWEIKPSDEAGYVIIVNGSAQFNQTNIDNEIRNWGNATNITDTGCKYMFVLTDYSDDTVLNDIKALVSTAKAKIAEVIQEGVGYYPSTQLDQDLIAKIDEIEATYNSADLTSDERKDQKADLQVLYDAFLAGYAAGGVNQPKSGVYYNMHTPNRGSRYATVVDHVIVGNASASEASAWTFVSRPDGSYDIKNYATGEYISPVADNDTQLSATDMTPEAGWKVLASNQVGFAIIVSGSTQLNQTKAGQNWKVYNWGAGTNKTDDGCKYVFTETNLKTDGIDMPVAGAVQRNQIYDLQGRRIATPSRPGIYIVDGRKVVMK